jgi:GTP-binding protein
MKITDAFFYKSAFEPAQLPAGSLPEIAFSGRSNVGKSSLINALLHRRGLAKTSSTPGRTQSINFISVNKAFYFVDLPGYGYAKVPASVKIKWQHLIESYLCNRPSLRLVVLIVDARRDPADDEAQFADWLQQQGIAFAVVLTKADKLKRNQLIQSAGRWRNFLGIESTVAFSAVTGEGKTELWKTLISCL